MMAGLASSSDPVPAEVTPAEPSEPIIPFSPANPAHPADPADPNQANPTTHTESITPPEIQVFAPAETLPLSQAQTTNVPYAYAPPFPPTTSVAELDEAFFEPTLSDVQSHHASVLARSRRLNEAPLLTGKHRDEERLVREKRKSEKWPTTTIRIKFSDGTQIQSTFPSISPIQPVYAFIRTALDPSASSTPFVLWQPPRNQYPEHPIPQKKANPHKTNIIPPANYGPVRGAPTPGLQGGRGGKESLNELGLVPQSVLLIRWEEEAMNSSDYPAPILPELKEKIVPLPTALPKEEEKKASIQSGSSSGPPAQGEKKIPKWLQKGLMKRK